MIKVLHPGIYNTVQDKGRVGFAKKGIPKSGCMDLYSAELANIALQNKVTSAVIEITYGQGKFEFLIDTLIFIAGADFSPRIDTFPVLMDSVISIKKGSILSFGKRNYGARTYLAVLGGIQSEVVFKSRSYFPGITKQRLEKGDELFLSSIPFPKEKNLVKVRFVSTHFSENELHCYPGPEFDLLNEEQKKQLNKEFTVSEENNRVGFRFNETIENNASSILTSAVLQGTVQLTPSGQLIVLMRDCQVTGGYPRVLQLSEYAISRLSQKIRGDRIRFKLY